MISEIGDSHYVELASVVVTTAAADAFCEAMGIDHEPLPEPEAGEPDRERPDGMGDIGAWVPVQVIDWKRANVARAMSLVPEGVRTFFRMVAAMYTGTASDFDRMVWDHRPLAPPPGRAARGQGLGPQPVLLLNDRPHHAAPGEQRRSRSRSRPERGG